MHLKKRVLPEQKKGGGKSKKKTTWTDVLVPSPSLSSSSTATTNCSSSDSAGAQSNTSKEEETDKIEIPMLDPCSFSSPTQPLLLLRPWRRLSAPELGISLKNIAYCLLLLLPGWRRAVPSKTAATE
jgi:hypothetical protein